MGEELRLPYDIFVENIHQFIKQADMLHDNWTLIEYMREDYNLYITKRVLKCFDQKLDTELNPEQPSELLEEFDKTFITFEYHIAYSISYGVPLLCVNLFNMDGKRLSASEAWKYFNKNYAQEDMKSVLTPQDHPVLQTPILVLHPCRTLDVLNDIIRTSKNPVVSWLSAIGPAMHLHLSNDYEKLTRFEEKEE